jgi:sugar phosphate isomerase/epimerase
LDGIKGLLAKYNLELIPSAPGDFICTGDQLRRGQESAITAINRYRDFGGVRMINVNVPMTYNRFSKQMPVDEQLDMLTEGVRPVVKAAEEAGIVYIMANHYDYRASEMLRVIQAVNSPNLQSMLELGCPFGVGEDPVDATRLLAPYIWHVHFKDVRVVPWTPSSAGYYAAQYTVPLGEGNVDLLQVVQILHENAPDPQSLCLAVETAPLPPNEDEDRWVQENVAWMRKNLRDYLN